MASHAEAGQHRDLREELNHSRGLRRSQSDVGDTAAASTGDLREKLNRERRGEEGEQRQQQQRRRDNHNSNSNRSRGGGGGGGKQLARPKKNTENFSPCHEPPPMRVVVATPGLRLVTRRFK